MYRQTINTRASLAQRYPTLVTVAAIAGMLIVSSGFAALLIHQLCK